MKLRERIGLWIAGPDYLDALEAGKALDLALRFGRRSNYDLLHAIDFIPPRWASFADHWRAAARARLAVLVAGNTVKDYRLKLHMELDAAHANIERLQGLLQAAGVEDPERIPF